MVLVPGCDLCLEDKCFDVAPSILHVLSVRVLLE